MTTIDDLLNAKQRRAVLQFGGNGSDYRYTIAHATECPGWDCPVAADGKTCAGVIDLEHTDHPGDRGKAFDAHVATTDTLRFVA